MAITEEELNDLIEPKGDIEKVSTLSSDGRALLTRVPRDIEQELQMVKGNKLIWTVNKKENKIELSISGTKLLKNGS